MVKLSRPIEGRRTLKFRELLSGDVAACGFPFDFVANTDGSMTIRPDPAAVNALIARLGKVPRKTVERLPFVDWIACMSVIAGQFTPPQALNGRAVPAKRPRRRKR